MSSDKNSDPTPTDTDKVSEMMVHLRIISPPGTDHAEGQHQSPPSRPSNLADDQLLASPGLGAKPQTPSRNPTTPSSDSSSKKQQKKLLKEAEDGYHKGPKQVKVLRATRLFTYDSIENKRMFHATVATETEFFSVMVFEENLQAKFTPGNVIAFSDYIGMFGSLVIHKDSSVSEVKSKLSSDENAIANPKIRDLHLSTREMHVYGEFKVSQKRVEKNFIYYEVKDRTGPITVIVSGHLTSVKCEVDDTLRLVCFELTLHEKEWFLRATRYSYMEVTKTKK